MCYSWDRVCIPTRRFQMVKAMILFDVVAIVGFALRLGVRP